MNNKNKVLVMMFITLIVLFINLKVVYGKVSSTDVSNAQPGSLVSIAVNVITKTDNATVELLNEGGLEYRSVSGGTETGDKIVTMSKSALFSGEIGRFTFYVPENDYGKTFNVIFSVESDAGIEKTTAVVKTKAKPAQTNNNGGNSSSNPAPSSKQTSKKSSEVVSEKENKSNNKIAVERAINIDDKNNNKSSNNYLKGISIDAGTLSPAFNRSQSSYVVSFPYDFDYKTLDKVKIGVTKEDDKEKISGIGVKEVKIGSNVYNILVTAENGETRTYTIKLIKPEVSEDKHMRLSSLKLVYKNADGNDVELPLDKAFNSEVFEYAINVDSTVESIDVKSMLPEGSEGIKVSVTGNTDLQPGQNTIIVTLENENDDSENPKKTMYTINVNKAEAVPAETQIQEMAQPVENKGTNIKFVIGIILGIILLLILILVILLIINKKQKKNLEESYGFNDEEDDDYNDGNNNNNLGDDSNMFKIDDNDVNYSDLTDVQNSYDVSSNDERASIMNGIEKSYMDDDIVRKEDIEKAKIFEDNDDKILNSDFNDSSVNDDGSLNDGGRRSKGKRFL